MVRTRFRNAELVDTNLSSSNLKRATFRGADLRCADLSFSTLRRADLRGAELSGADLSSSACGNIRFNADTTFCRTIGCDGDVVNPECEPARCADGSCRTDCCAGVECGPCRTCAENGQCDPILCTDSTPCPGDCECSGGVCGTRPTCAGFAQRCSEHVECCSRGCGALTCNCSQSGEACYDDSACCPNPAAQTCIGFVCQPE